MRLSNCAGNEDGSLSGAEDQIQDWITKFCDNDNKDGFVSE